MMFDEQIINLVIVTSTTEGDNDSSVDKSLNSKTGQYSPVFHHLPGQAVPLDIAEAATQNNLSSQD